MHKDRAVVRSIKAFSVIFTAVILITMFTPLANLLAKPLIVKPSLQKADLIIVLGGGAYRNGSLGRSSNERLLKGLLLYKEGYAPKVLFSGGTISGRLEKIGHTLSRSEDAGDITVYESDIMKEAAVTLGIDPEDLPSDWESANTYGNISQAKAYMEKNGLKTCILVTSPAHMMRVFLVSEKMGLGCFTGPVDDYTEERTSGLDRLSLMKEVIREYAGLALYRLYGYI